MQRLARTVSRSVRAVAAAPAQAIRHRVFTCVRQVSTSGARVAPRRAFRRAALAVGGATLGLYLHSKLLRNVAEAAEASSVNISDLGLATPQLHAIAERYVKLLDDFVWLTELAAAVDALQLAIDEQKQANAGLEQAQTVAMKELAEQQALFAAGVLADHESRDTTSLGPSSRRYWALTSLAATAGYFLARVLLVLGGMVLGKLPRLRSAAAAAALSSGRYLLVQLGIAAGDAAIVGGCSLILVSGWYFVYLMWRFLAWAERHKAQQERDAHERVAEQLKQAAAKAIEAERQLSAEERERRREAAAAKELQSKQARAEREAQLQREAAERQSKAQSPAGVEKIIKEAHGVAVVAPNEAALRGALAAAKQTGRSAAVKDVFDAMTATLQEIDERLDQYTRALTGNGATVRAAALPAPLQARLEAAERGGREAEKQLASTTKPLRTLAESKRLTGQRLAVRGERARQTAARMRKRCEEMKNEREPSWPHSSYLTLGGSFGLLLGLVDGLLRPLVTVDMAEVSWDARALAAAPYRKAAGASQAARASASRAALPLEYLRGASAFGWLGLPLWWHVYTEEGDQERLRQLLRARDEDHELQEAASGLLAAASSDKA